MALGLDTIVSTIIQRLDPVDQGSYPGKTQTKITGSAAYTLVQERQEGGLVACPQPLWQSAQECKDLPESLFENILPWDLAAALEDFSSEASNFVGLIEWEMGGLPAQASQLEKAWVIYHAVTSLDWTFNYTPSGLSCADILETPVGNCVDVTNLLYALFQYFEIESFPVYVHETIDGNMNHYCLGIQGDDGETILVDASFEEGFGIDHREWYALSDAEFLSVIHNGRGVKADLEGDYSLALDEYTQSSEICSCRPIPMLNAAGVYMGNEDLGPAGELIDQVSSQGYESAQFSYIQGFYNLNIKDQEGACEDFQEALEQCSSHQGAQKQFDRYCTSE